MHQCGEISKHHLKLTEGWVVIAYQTPQKRPEHKPQHDDGCVMCGCVVVFAVGGVRGTLVS